MDSPIPTNCLYKLKFNCVSSRSFKYSLFPSTVNILAKLQFNPHHSVVKQLIVAILVVERLVTVVCSRPLSKYAATPHHTHHISHTITDTSHTHITASTVDTIGKKKNKEKKKKNNKKMYTPK